MTNCTAQDNGSTGIRMTGTGTISKCVAFSNDNHGIFATGGLIEGCTVIFNGSDGIHPLGGYVLNNLCKLNTNGIGSETADNRIEGNQLVANTGIGLNLTSSGNFVFKNCARSNGTNYSVAGGSNVGPIVSGPAGGSANPWANFQL